MSKQTVIIKAYRSTSTEEPRTLVMVDLNDDDFVTFSMFHGYYTEEAIVDKVKEEFPEITGREIDFNHIDIDPEDLDFVLDSFAQEKDETSS